MKLEIDPCSGEFLFWAGIAAAVLVGCWLYVIAFRRLMRGVDVDHEVAIPFMAFFALIAVLLFPITILVLIGLAGLKDEKK